MNTWCTRCGEAVDDPTERYWTCCGADDCGGSSCMHDGERICSGCWDLAEADGEVSSAGQDEQATMTHIDEEATQ